MRILFVHTGADMYGASRSLLRLSRGLVRDGHGVTCVLPYEGPLRAELAAAGVATLIDRGLPLFIRGDFRCPLRALRRAFGAARALAAAWRLLGRLRPDLAHTNTASVFPSYGLAARLRGIPHVAHIRESFADFGPLWRVFQWLLAVSADRIIAVSAAVAAQFAPSIRRKTVVIHNGLPADEFARVEPERVAAFRRRYGLADFRLVGLVGRIKMGRKGQDDFVRAAARLGAWHDRVRFLVIGSPFPGNEEHERELQRLIDSLNLRGIVLLTGDVAEIKAAISAMDVVAMASARPEPFGGVVLEAMALGRPVVGTATGGTVEQIEDGVTGFLVPPDDPQAMAAAVERLLENPGLAAQMGEAGRKRCSSLFGFDAFYGKIAGVYGSLLAGRSVYTRIHEGGK